MPPRSRVPAGKSRTAGTRARRCPRAIRYAGGKVRTRRPVTSHRPPHRRGRRARRGASAPGSAPHPGVLSPTRARSAGPIIHPARRGRAGRVATFCGRAASGWRGAPGRRTGLVPRPRSEVRHLGRRVVDLRPLKRGDELRDAGARILRASWLHGLAGVSHLAWFGRDKRGHPPVRRPGDESLPPPAKLAGAGGGPGDGAPRRRGGLGAPKRKSHLREEGRRHWHTTVSNTC